DVIVGEVFGADGVPAGIRGVVTGAADLFDAGSVAVMAGRLVRVREAVPAEPGVRVSGGRVLDAAEREQLVREGNEAGVEAAAARGRRVSGVRGLGAATRVQLGGGWSGAGVGVPAGVVRGLMGGRAGGVREAGGVAGDGGVAVCYGELAARAGRLAGYLRGLG